jgi:enoyl-CoA hydratase/carnithine racemase
MSAQVRREISANNVGVITIDNPPLNLLSVEVTDGLVDSLDEFEAAGLRALVVRAAGKNFSGGADVARFRNMSREVARAELSKFMVIIRRLENFPAPTMALVQGVCTAGGLEVALACDMIWAGEGARFCQGEASIGAIPFGGGAQRLAERAGIARAKEIVFGAGMYSATEFERWNIVNRVVDDESLPDKAMKYANRLAAGPTRAYTAVKQVLREGVDSGMASADRAVVEYGSALFDTEDLQTGVVTLLKEGPGKGSFTGK